MNLKSKLESGQFAILAEIDPPKGVDTSGMVANTKKVKGKIDVFVVPEMSNAVMRMSSLSSSLSNHLSLIPKGDTRLDEFPLG